MAGFEVITEDEAQGRRRKHSRTRGRKQTPAEVVLRMLILKHARNWSFETLEQEVRVNLATAPNAQSSQAAMCSTSGPKVDKLALA